MPRLSIDQMIEQNKPPRQRLDGLVTMHRDTFAGLSRLIGRDKGYLQGYVSRGVPSGFKITRKGLDFFREYFKN